MKNALPKIEGYRIEGVLGRGATGVVYSAVQLAVDRPVAIKVLHPELVGKRSAVRRLQREARTTARLAHPGIISAIDMGEQDGLWWYAMELVEGISLGERLAERGPMTEREALRFFLPLVEALQHAYEGGVVHRDIKPSNILVDGRGKARLVDLGLAFAEDDPMVTKPGGTLGTPHYISPEQARDPSSADTKSDLWSLGATMYHAVCGRPPFEGSSVAEILSGVLYQRVPDPRLYAPALSKGLTLVLRKCLSRDPLDRYAEPQALGEDLERIVERRAPAVHARSLDPVDDGRPPWLRKALIGGGAGVAVLALLLAWSPWSAPSSPQATEATTREAKVLWPALDQLRERYLAGSLPLADVAARLKSLTAPAGAEGQRALLDSRLQLDLDEALQALVNSLGSELDGSLVRKDLFVTKQLLDEVPARIQGATGYTDVGSLPASPARTRLERLLQSRQLRLAQAREAVRRRARTALTLYLEGQLIPAVEAARDGYRWGAARDSLDSRDEWLVAAGVAGPLLPEDEEQILDAGEDILVPVGTTLFAHYRRVAEDLERYLGEQEALLRQSLGGGRSDAAGELRARYEAKLTSLGLDPAQVPEDYQVRRPLGARLEVLAQGLAADEAEVLNEDAQDDYLADLLLVNDLLRSRRFDEALELWDLRLADPWRAALHGEMLDRRREAELLEGLLQQAAVSLRSMHGERLDVTLDGITHSAVVVATRPAVELADVGIQLSLDDLERPVRVHLRASAEADGRGFVLPASTLLGLAGVGAMDQAGFVSALFLFYEGRLEDARERLPLGPIEDTVLLNDLRARIQSALSTEQDREAARLEEKDRRLRALRRDLENGRSTYQGMLGQGRQLLRSYGDLLSKEERAEVEGVCEDCARRLASPTLEQRYAAAAITRRFNGAVTLTWTFEEPAPGAWELGHWARSPIGPGLRLTREPGTHEEFWAREHALCLPLGGPLDTGEAMDLTMRLRWAEDHDEFENDLVLSIAGTHLLFVDGPPDRLQAWTMTAEDPRGRLELLRKEQPPRFGGFSGFSRTEPFELRVQLSTGRGRMKVWLDGEQLTMPREFLKAGIPEDSELLLRSWYALELLEVRLEARLQ